MPTQTETKTTQQLLAEADELIRHIHSDVIMDFKEEQLIAFEKHAQELERIKSLAKAKKDPDKKQAEHSAADGIHEAILDIVKAMQDWKNKLF